MRITDNELEAITYEELVGPKPAEDFSYDDVWVLHMGYCHLFALALHERFDLDLWMITELCIHYFCRKGNLYIDACGYDIKFYHPYSGEDITGADMVPVGNINLGGDYVNEGLAFVKVVIERNPDLYCQCGYRSSWLDIKHYGTGEHLIRHVVITILIWSPHETSRT